MSIGLGIDAVVANRWPKDKCQRYVSRVDRACSGYSAAENRIKRQLYWWYNKAESKIMNHLTPHQRDMIEALRKVPKDTGFVAGDMKKLYGYPHSDASRVLQQAAIFTVFVCYHKDGLRNNKIEYCLRSGVAGFDFALEMYDKYHK